MTRDEALEKLPNDVVESSKWLVDSLAALGLLKLDEPKSVLTRTVDAIDVALRTPIPAAFKYGNPGNTLHNWILFELEAAGLKIVEKD